jgi:hypothetical protein
MPLNLSPASVKCDWGCTFDSSVGMGICTLILGGRFTLPEGSEDCRQKPSPVPGPTCRHLHSSPKHLLRELGLKYGQSRDSCIAKILESIRAGYSVDEQYHPSSATQSPVDVSFTPGPISGQDVSFTPGPISGQDVSGVRN